MSIRQALLYLGAAAESLTAAKQELVSGLLPPEAGAHFRNAEHEALLGVRALLDAAIERREARANSESGRSQSTEATTIKVED